MCGESYEQDKKVTVIHKNEKRKKKKNIYDIEKFNKTNKRLIQLEFRTECNQQQSISMIMVVKCLRAKEVCTRNINYRPRYVDHLKQLELKTESNQQLGLIMTMVYKYIHSREARTRSIKHRLRCVFHLKLVEGIKYNRGGLVAGRLGPNLLPPRQEPIEGLRNVLGLAGPNKTYDPG